MKRTIYIPLLFLLPLLFGCNTARHAWYGEEEQGWQQQPLPDSQQLRYTLFLLGDGSKLKPGKGNPVLDALRPELAAAGKNSAVVFLGDNAPTFNPEKERSRRSIEKHLLLQLETVGGYQGKTYFLPGEKEWNNGRPDGLKTLQWQEEFVESRLGDPDAFQPGGGCGDPGKVKIHDDLRLLFLDSQWWLDDWRQLHGINENCDARDRFAFLQEVEDYLKKNDGARIVALMHHPLASNGKHGGSFSWKHHLFPLTMWKKNAWLPLPGLGTLAVMVREAGAYRQDLVNTRYLRLKEELLKIAAKKPANQSLIFVGAHDNSLQYFEGVDEKTQFVVSGAMGQTSYARGGRRARFVYAREGYAKLCFYKNNEAWLEFRALGEDGKTASVAFRKRLFEGTPQPSDPVGDTRFAPLPDSVAVPASTLYKAGALQKFTLGNRYRPAWLTPVSVPVFNLEKEFSHLTPIQQGGGMSSKSLRLTDENGQEFVLRSINKDVGRGLPKEVRRTVVQDIIQDFKSGSHPYSAFVVPHLAEAAGIYHTNPRLFYLPPQQRLGVYNEHFAGEMYLFEERPSGNWKGLASFGNSSEIISFLSLLDKLKKDAKNRVDEKWVLKSRLFDQWINDYDRHDDQWRWAVFPQDNGQVLYRPVPRDRDQAFFDLRGAAPFLLSRRFLAVQQRGFYEKIHDVPGQASLASVFDRSFLTGLDRAAWQAVALDMQQQLTDSVVEQAFRVWPPEIHRLNAPSIIETLKRRRDHIPEHADKLYLFLARYVNVRGTDNSDLFEVKRIPGGDVEVRVFSLKKNGDKGERFYHRVFVSGETREVRLFGLNGDDVFDIAGDGGRSIHVRVVGGEGDDRVNDRASLGNSFRKTTVYDTPNGMSVSGKVWDHRDNTLKINEYDRTEFRYNRYFPIITFGRTLDDGLLYGAGVRLKYYQFRKEPYGSMHYFFTRFSTNTDALSLYYTGDFISSIGKLDFNPDLRFDRPVIFNFFGLGNRTVDTSSYEQFNWVRLEKLSISPLLKKNWYNGRNFTRFGPFLERVEVENRPGRITDTGLLAPDQLKQKHFLGFTIQHRYQSLDHPGVPRNGMKIDLSATWYRNLTTDRRYARFEAIYTSYLTLGSPVEVTIANRIGIATLTRGDFLFYHSNNLGGNTYLRGFRNNRFAGRSMFFHNFDLRIKLLYWRNTFVPFEFGLMGGLDYGPVWDEGRDAGLLHIGYSPGVWFTPFRFSAVTAFYTFTNAGERDTYTVRLGFFF